MAAKIVTVYCVMETHGCPEEGRPFVTEVRAVCRTAAKARAIAAAQGGWPPPTVEWRTALVDPDWLAGHGGHAEFLVLLPGEWIEAFSRPAPVKRAVKRKRRRKGKR